MDTIHQIESEVAKLKSLKEDLTREIDELQHESYDVKDDAFGLANRVKALTATIMKHSTGLSSMLGEALGHSVHREFDNAQEYLDYLSQTISKIREYISQIDQAIANLEKCKSDLNYQLQAVQTWLNRSKELQ